MHWPVALKKGAEGTAPEDFAPLDTKATWQAMEKCVESGGKTKAIGISNFSVEKTEKLLSYAKVAPVVNQVEFRWWDFAGFSLYGEHLCSNA